jgi:murein DD-endopeptidase MepM/ murein hydrolase activator NlpD
LISLFSAVAVAVTFVAAIAPPIHIPGQSRSEEGRFPAPPGYLLPWAGGEIHTVTQGEETTFTHNGSTAYAYDFDLSYDTIVAARSGKVLRVREDSNAGGCDPSFSTAANYVVIDHGDGTTALYLHLAYNGVTVAPGDIVDQGDPIAISGETGLTCADDENGGPGPHLHFQVQRFDEARPLTQSVPVAFDDIPSNNGVPQDGKSYVSGNFGKGQEQKIKLTPWRVPRVFNPTARPENPHLKEEPAPPPPSPTPPAPEALASESATPTETPTEPPTITPVPDDTSTPEPDDTDTPEPDKTNTPVASETPAAGTPTPAPSDTTTPLPDDTPTSALPPTEAPPTEGPATTQAAPTGAPATLEPAPTAAP